MPALTLATGDGQLRCEFARLRGMMGRSQADSAVLSVVFTAGCWLAWLAWLAWLIDHPSVHPTLCREQKGGMIARRPSDVSQTRGACLVLNGTS